MLYNKSELSNFCKTALMAQGVSEKNAQVTTALLIEADEMGIHSHGVKNLHKYIEKIRLGKLNPACQIEVISDMPGCAVLDAHNSIGMVSGYRGMKLAMEKARKTGIGYVCVRNSCHFGAGGVYSNLAAREGMFGIAMSNTDPNMAIPGTIGMTIGNNPFSYAYPKENGQSVFLDIALSATAALKINKAKQAHEQIPNTWLIDDHGNATTDPSWYGIQHSPTAIDIRFKKVSGDICRNITRIITGSEHILRHSQICSFKFSVFHLCTSIQLTDNLS